MDRSKSNIAQQLAQAAIAFEEERTGQVPESVTVVLSEGTLVITLHGVLSPAEKDLARSPGGAAKLREFHRELFNNACGDLREKIKRITGVEVHEAAVEVEPETGTVVQVFSTGTIVQVFLLARGISADTWNATKPVAS